MPAARAVERVEQDALRFRVVEVRVAVDLFAAQPTHAVVADRTRHFVAAATTQRPRDSQLVLSTHCSGAVLTPRTCGCRCGTKDKVATCASLL